MSRFINSGTLAVAVGLVAVIAGAGSLLAEDGLRTPPAANATVKKECGACHMVYPPGLLPARSWAALTGTLKDHFGENAELDAASTEEITAYLTANAGDAKGKSPLMRDLAAQVTPARITDLPWWKAKHEKRDRVAPATLAKKGAKFKGDCKACHAGAEKGYFEDD